MTEEIIRGSIAWNLPESIQFTPGETIPATITITNPTEERRIYALPWALIRSGVIVSVGMVTVDDTADWWVDGGESEEISFELSPEITDCYFNISLLGGITLEEEEAEVVEEIIDSLTTYLYSVEVSPLAIQAQWVQYIIPTLVAMGLIGGMLSTMVPAVKEVFKK